MLGRLLAGEPLVARLSPTDLDRTQPHVHVVDVQPADSGRVHVLVAARQSDEEGVRDLKLFRDRQLVGTHPLNRQVEAFTNDEAWVFHDGAMVETRDFARAGPFLGAVQSWIVAFRDIELPTSGSGAIEFSAYAFNADGIKSETHRISYLRPGEHAARRTAFLIVVGVNAYENPAWDLQYAAHDARATGKIVSRHLRASGQFEEVNIVSLVSERNDSGQMIGAAGRADLITVLDVLAGGGGNLDRLAMIPGAASLRSARPDDLVYLTFSGHGLSGDDGVFHFFLSDIGEGHERRVDSKLLARTLDSDLLASYVRRVDAGKFVFVVDACNSAASVRGGGFKPGPMGSRGLGQLAYDKAMMVVAASQMEDVALESGRLRHGLLTYAILREGLQGGAADRDPADGVVGFAELLSYGVERVPVLYEELSSRRFVPQGRSTVATPFLPSGQVTESPQQPSLFDFSRGDWGIRLPVIAPGAAPDVAGVASASLATGTVLTPVVHGAKEVGETFRDDLRSGGTGPEMVVIPAGSFQMGCVSGMACYDEEHPVHQVRIDQAFAVSKYEVTIEEWEACERASGCSEWAGIGLGQGRDPVINVSWQDAQDYVRWLSEQTGETYRLLTESEWEYAARAGTNTAYSWGNEMGSGRANSGVESPDGTIPTGRGAVIGPTGVVLMSKRAPVGSFAPNGWGLHDMHGNVREWVQDCWHESYDGAPTEGGPWLQDDCSARVVRGGSGSTVPRKLRAAFRESGHTDWSLNDLGFRVTRTLMP